MLRYIATEKKKKKRKHEELETKGSGERTEEEQKRHDEKKKEKRRRKAELAAAAAAESAEPTSSSPKSSPSQSEIDAFLAKNSITITVPDSSSPVTPVLSFSQLNVPPQLSEAFSAKYKFKEPTPIQACTWPPALEGKDVVGIAETGSGKTLAFGLPSLASLISSKHKKITTLVLAPTRELAIQTHDTLLELGQALGIGSVAVYGGVPKEGQVRLLRNIQKSENSSVVTRIIVGTPGRILDLVSEGVCDLSHVSYLVLDEADRMLDKGFENDIRKIISYTKQGTERQTLMFSATWPTSVRRLASSFLLDPIRVTVGTTAMDETPTANKRVEQEVYVLDDKWGKEYVHSYSLYIHAELILLYSQLLLTHLRAFLSSVQKSQSRSDTNATTRVLVFVLYKAEGPRVVSSLSHHNHALGIEVDTLHGNMSQSARLEALEWFKGSGPGKKNAQGNATNTRILVATDVAARGLDIPDVGLVLNYTFPLTIEDYVHRIGRTGKAFTICVLQL